ncbi:UNVERIFIED_CONTAM: hypothetical protein FKN15_065097 [Acipenser sinensis]
MTTYLENDNGSDEDFEVGSEDFDTSDSDLDLSLYSDEDFEVGSEDFDTSDSDADLSLSDDDEEDVEPRTVGDWVFITDPYHDASPPSFDFAPVYTEKHQWI